MEVLEDTPNNFGLTKDAPQEYEAALDYYDAKLEFFPQEFPEEFGIIHFSMAKLYFGKYRSLSGEPKAKCIESCLMHFSKAVEVFTDSSHPIMYAVICILVCRVFRDRADICEVVKAKRSIMTNRGTPAESIKRALEKVVEAYPILSMSKQHATELSVCCLETGRLYLIQVNDPDNYAEDSALREQAVSNFERAISLAQSTANAIIGERPRNWNAQDINTHPVYVKLLLEGKSLLHLEGLALYYLGKVYEEWGNSVPEHQANAKIAFDYYSKCIKTKYLSMDCPEWADAHHSCAAIILKYPTLVDPDYGKDQSSENDLYIQSAISHLMLALRCTGMDSAGVMDIQFHLAQAHVARLHLITDHIPHGESLSKALAESEGLEILATINLHLAEASKHVTAASTQSTQDAFVFFYTCLKRSELCMLDASAHSDLSSKEREKLLSSAVRFIIDGVNARPLSDNFDLQFMATSQMSLMLLAARRYYAASKSYAKNLLSLSAMINRISFQKDQSQQRLGEEMARQVGQALCASYKETIWVKRHFGQVLLTESITPGYANWSFEEEELWDSIAAKKSYEDDKLKLGLDTAKQPLEGALNRAPPKTLPPLVPKAKQKNNLGMNSSLASLTSPPGAAVGMVSNSAGELAGGQSVTSQSLSSSANFKTKPPEGKVPLHAFGHKPDLSQLQYGGVGVHAGPYGRRRRKRVPELEEVVQRSAEATIKQAAAVQIMPAEAHVKKKLHIVGMSSLAAPVPSASSEAALQSASANNRRDLDDDRAAKLPKDGSDDDDEDDNEDDDGDDNDNDNDDDDGDDERHQSSHKNVSKVTVKVKRKTESTAGKKSSNSGGFLAKFRQIFGNRRPEQILFDATNKLLESTLGTPALLGDAAKQVVEEELKAHMWSSTQCYYTFMTLSRLARSQLVVRGKQLNVLRGERVQCIFRGLSEHVKSEYKRITKELNDDCKTLTPSPFALRELAQKSYKELRVIFKSHAKTYRFLAELEGLLTVNWIKEDRFVPLMHVAPAITKDFSGFDKALTDADFLLSNIKYEEVISTKKRLKAERLALQDTTRTAGVTNNTLDAVTSSSVHDPLLEPKLTPEDEATEEDKLGSMTHRLSQCLDGTGLTGGAREMFEKYLEPNECMMLWHLPVVGAHNVQVVLVWRDESATTLSSVPAVDPTTFSRTNSIQMSTNNNPTISNVKIGTENETNEEAEEPELDGFGNKKPTKKKSKKGPKIRPRGIIMEVAKSDIDSAQVLYLLQAFLDAAHARPNPRRLSHSIDALRSLSGALSITELMMMVPKRVNSLIICCPAPMRVIPWHVLLCEVANELPPNSMKKSEQSLSTDEPPAPLQMPSPESFHEIHLIEQYLVRLGPTLQMFEMSCIYAKELKHAPGLHRLCCVDGEDADKKSPALRSCELEVACVTTTWSGDPIDYHVLMGERGAPSELRTTEATKVDLSNSLERKKAREEARLHKEAVRARQEASRLEKFMHRYRENGSDSEESSDTDDGNDEYERAAELSEEEDLEVNFDRLSLRMCRVLHVSAGKVPIDVNKRNAAIVMPARKHARKGKDLDPRKTFSASDVVSQLYFRNCSLCVLSRFGITDDISDPRHIDVSCEFIDSWHFAGATTVMYPVWSAIGQGIGTVATLVFFIRFYLELPKFAKDKRAISQAIRKTQLWLKSVTADDCIAFVARAPVPKKVRNEIIQEMESYVSASLSPSKAASQSADSPGPANSRTTPLKASAVKSQLATPGTMGNRKGGDRLFFSHFLNWGMFTMSGYGGNVHHPNLYGNMKEDTEMGATEKNVDLEVNEEEMEFEAALLRKEGHLQEASELEAHIIQVRRAKRKKAMQDVKATGLRAGRGLMDTLDLLDRALLDQDSDEVSVSDDDVEGSKHKGPQPPKGSKPPGVLPIYTAPLKKKANPLDRVKYHFGLAGGSATVAAVSDAHAEPDEDGIHMWELSPREGEDNPAGGGGKRMSAPGDAKAEHERKEELRKKALLDKDLAKEAKASKKRQAKLEAKQQENLKPGQPKRLIAVNPDEEDDDDDDDDDDPPGMSDDSFGSGIGLGTLARRKVRRMKDSMALLGDEVRSYADASHAAKEMLAMLPMPSRPKSDVCVIS